MHRAPRRRPVLATAAAALVLAGVALILVGWVPRSSAALPPHAGVRVAAQPAPSTPDAPVPSSTAPAGLTLSHSLPVRLSIEAIGVRASIVPLGLNPDGTVQVPPLSRPMETSWYDRGPAP